MYCVAYTIEYVQSEFPLSRRPGDWRAESRGPLQLLLLPRCPAAVLVVGWDGRGRKGSGELVDAIVVVALYTVRSRSTSKLFDNTLRAVGTTVPNCNTAYYQHRWVTTNRIVSFLLFIRSSLCYPVYILKNVSLPVLISYYPAEYLRSEPIFFNTVFSKIS